MPYRVNVDYPRKVARIHWDEPRRKSCQPRDKRGQDGFWSDPLPTKQDVRRLAEAHGVDARFCRFCFNTV